MRLVIMIGSRMGGSHAAVGSLLSAFARQCVKMSAVITNTAACEIRSTIRFLNARGCNAVEIHRRISFPHRRHW